MHWKWKFQIHPSICTKHHFFGWSNDQMWTPNRIQWHIPKRIKSAAHLIVNCKIKPNWIPITIHWLGLWNSTALFFPYRSTTSFFFLPLFNRIDAYIRIWIGNLNHKFRSIQCSWYYLNFLRLVKCLEFHDVSHFIVNQLVARQFKNKTVPNLKNKYSNDKFIFSIHKQEHTHTYWHSDTYINTNLSSNISNYATHIHIYA